MFRIQDLTRFWLLVLRGTCSWCELSQGNLFVSCFIAKYFRNIVSLQNISEILFHCKIFQKYCFIAKYFRNIVSLQNVSEILLHCKIFLKYCFIAKYFRNIVLLQKNVCKIFYRGSDSQGKRKSLKSLSHQDEWDVLFLNWKLIIFNCVFLGQ